MKLNLGCGNDKRTLWLNCDIDEGINPDKIVDMRLRLPFRDNSIEEIYCDNILEHIDSDILMEYTLPEIARILEPDGKLTVIVPYLDAQPTLDHKTRFTEETFNNWGSFFGLKKKEHKLGIRWFHRPIFWIPLKSWKMWFSHLIAEVRMELKKEGEKHE